MASVLAEFDQEEYEEMIRRESEEEGFRRGLSQGIEQGQIQERIASILELLEDVGAIPEQLQKTIEAQTDMECLKKMFILAAKVSSMEEFEEKMKEIE